MRYVLIGLMMSCVFGVMAVSQASAEDLRNEVTGVPIYHGPSYTSLDVTRADIENLPPEYHSFHQLPVEEVGYSPLTLADFRYPVVRRTARQFEWERIGFPEHSTQVWESGRHGYEITAYFFTRDMIRDHIQRLIDEYYICEDDIIQQMIDYYAEVTPQAGEAITWVWFRVSQDSHDYFERAENRYFESYLDNFEDKFFLEFGVPKVQDMLDEDVHEFLYQYRDRGKYACSPDIRQRVCNEDCTDCEIEKPEAPEVPDDAEGPQCFQGSSAVCDEGLWSEDYSYHGYHYDHNKHYAYYPNKVILEDMTYDHLAQAYRWKFAWRFTDCEVDLLNELCRLNENIEMALLVSDPHWYSRNVLDRKMVRNILASVDPQTWGNVWHAGDLPVGTECVNCWLPSCDGNCFELEAVGWEYIEPEPEIIIEPEVPDSPGFDYFPETTEVTGHG
jgi:hypothetical protein